MSSAVFQNACRHHLLSHLEQACHIVATIVTQKNAEIEALCANLQTIVTGLSKALTEHSQDHAILPVPATVSPNGKDIFIRSDVLETFQALTSHVELSLRILIVQQLELQADITEKLQCLVVPAPVQTMEDSQCSTTRPDLMQVKLLARAVVEKKDIEIAALGCHAVALEKDIEISKLTRAAYKDYLDSSNRSLPDLYDEILLSTSINLLLLGQPDQGAAYMTGQFDTERNNLRLAEGGAVSVQQKWIGVQKLEN
ncbi:hypothetical protein F5146DRAFT_1005529 [Armillaria mellea]|nr:hypothetical protein F5146DRAFT_1005529 [Armillaria mellea]